MEKQTMHAAINDVKITSGLLGRVSKLVKEQVLPYQWDILNDVAKDAVPDHSIENFSVKTVILRNGWRPLHTD